MNAEEPVYYKYFYYGFQLFDINQNNQQMNESIRYQRPIFYMNKKIINDGQEEELKLNRIKTTVKFVHDADKDPSVIFVTKRDDFVTFKQQTDVINNLGFYPYYSIIYDEKDPFLKKLAELYQRSLKNILEAQVLMKETNN